MYERIKALADEAIALQNKARMEEVLREISGMCATAGAMSAEQFEAAETAQRQAARGVETHVTYPTSTLPGGDPPEVTAALKRSMRKVGKGAKK
jgi:hypothetical protein